MSGCVLSDFFLQRVQGARLRCLVSLFLVCTLLLCVSTAGCGKKKDDHGGLSWSATEEVAADADAWVSENDRDSNYGPDTDLWAGYLFPSADSECDIYLFFNVSSVVPAQQLSSRQN